MARRWLLTEKLLVRCPLTRCFFELHLFIVYVYHSPLQHAIYISLVFKTTLTQSPVS